MSTDALLNIPDLFTDEFYQRIELAHKKKEEEFLWQALEKIGEMINWNLSPQLFEDIKILYTSALRNSISVTYRTKPILCLTWNHPAGQYRVLEEFPFPYNP